MPASLLHSSTIFRFSQLLPTVCMVCGKSIQAAYSLCRECEAELPWIQSACFRCGSEYPEDQLLGNRCGTCLLNPPPFRQCQSLFNYTQPISTLIADFKFRGQLDIGFALAWLLAERMLACYRIAPKPDLLIPVPLHRRRLRARGFNQALEIARLVARQCAIPMSNRAVRRTRHTPAQTTMNSARRRRLNLQNAFDLNRGKQLENVKSVALIDDVVTTGATVSELSKLLQSHGVDRVEVWCLARARN